MIKKIWSYDQASFACTNIALPRRRVDNLRQSALQTPACNGCNRYNRSPNADLLHTILWQQAFIALVVDHTL